jgi:hypothetical protein
MHNADASPPIRHALASLVRLASSFHLQPRRKTANGVARPRRTKMDFGFNQRFGTTLGLSEVPNNAHVEVAVPLWALLETPAEDRKIRQLRHVGRDPRRLILGEHLGRRTPAGLFLGFAMFASENHP